MKRVTFPTKPYSWVQFPVTMKGFDKPAHLTLKFFGGAEIDHYAVEQRCGTHAHQMLNMKLAEFVWEPKFWSSPHDHANYYVLAFVKYPSILGFMHKTFDLIRDPYIPWTPHITVTKEYFLLVEDQAFTPQECQLVFGEAELCLG
ncbi:MAG: hypothetical protein OEW15_11500, partial [Nitrospirota bacterium]|nr:hypothetical protein [Nitrospirota bacterium]